MMRPRITTWQCALAGGHFFKQARDLATSVPTHCTQKQETKFKQHRYASQLHFFSFQVSNPPTTMGEAEPFAWVIW
jgi:hypothetical protein